jgi:Concanavalin A-like lectin/glucanases superfamily
MREPDPYSLWTDHVRLLVDMKAAIAGARAMGLEVPDDEVIAAIESVPGHFAGFTEVTHSFAGSSNTTSATTSGVNTTGATLIVLQIASLTGVTVTVSDSVGGKSNTWIPLLTQSIPAIQTGTMYYCIPVNVGSGHTFTVTGGSACYPSICMQCFSGGAGEWILNQQRGTTVTVPATTAQPGSLTPTQGSSLVITGMACNVLGGTITPPSGFTANDYTEGSAGAYYGVGLGYLIQTSATAENPTWTDSLANSWATTQAVFLSTATAHSVTLDGSSQYGTSSNPFQTTGGNFNMSVVMWAKIASNPSANSALFEQRSSGGQGFVLYIDTSGKLNAVSTDHNGTSYTLVTTNAVPSNAGNINGWALCTFTYDGTTAKLALNAATSGSNFASTGTWSNNVSAVATTVYYGASDFGGLNGYFGGGICQTAMFSTVLSGANITSIYGLADIQTIAPVQGDMWMFTEGSGSSVSDAGSNLYAMTLIATPTWSTDTPFTNTLVAGTLTCSIASATSLTSTTAAATGGSSPYTYELQTSANGVSGWSNVHSLTVATPYTQTGLTTRVNVYYRVVVTDNLSNTANSAVVGPIYPAAAASWYWNESTGNDSTGTGSVGSPWKTMTNFDAFNQFPGDTYNFNGGDTFSEAQMNVQPNANPFAASAGGSAMTTVQSYGTGQAIINYANGTTNCIQVLNTGWVTVNNIAVTGPGVTNLGATTSGTQPLPVLSGTQSYTPNNGCGILLYSTATSGSNWNNIIVKNCTVSGTQWGIVPCTTCSNAGGAIVGYDGVQIYNNTIHDIELEGVFTTGGTTMVGSGTGWPTATNTFTGVYVGSNTVYNVRGYLNAHTGSVAQGGGGITLLNCTGAIVERNVCYSIGQTTLNGSCGIEAGICVNVTVRYNEVYTVHANATDGDAFDFDMGVTASYAYGNYGHECDGAGFLIGGNSTQLTQNNWIAYNVFRTCGTVYGGFFVLAVKNNNNVFLNNTCYGAVATAGVNAVSSPTGSGNYFINNIFYTTGGGVVVDSNIGSNATFLGNDYYTTGGTLSIGGNTGSGALAAWQNGGQETWNGVMYGVSADPMLQNPTAGGNALPGAQVATLNYYNLLSGSPCIGTGFDPTLVNVFVGSQDWRGNANRTGGLIDMGAVSFQAVIAGDDDPMLLSVITRW